MSELVNVWVTHAEGSTCVHRTFDTVLSDVEALAEGLCKDQAVEIRIERKEMKADVLEALPDFEGY
jgi:hypothetical protein